jgi:hypothetical protein
MLLSRDAQRLRPFLLGALFLSSLGHHRPAIGYTMTVWSDPYDSWGCVGACGGWDGGGYYDPYYSGDEGGGGGGDGGDDLGTSADNPFVLVIVAPGGCGTFPDIRETAASTVYRLSFAEGLCYRERSQDENAHYYYQVTFEDGSVGVYQRSDSSCASSHLMWEVRSPQCKP